MEHAPHNYRMTFPMIQKDIVTACKIETIKAIIEELNGGYFALLVDESFDMSHKEQMAVVLRYVDRKGFVMERLIDIVHVQDNSALSLKSTIVNLLSQHSLSLSYMRGQCYNGASNMQGEIKGLKKLIRQESFSAHSIHCFAHQLQLTLVAVEAFSKTFGLIRAGDTRWGSHYKSFCNFILMFGSIIDVLDALVVDAYSLDESANATGYLEACQTFKIAFMLHLMRDILGIIDELNKSLQKKEQDIANAMLLVDVAKRRLQSLRDDDWETLIDKVSTFCIKYNILIPNFDQPYVNSRRSRHLLHRVACLSPTDSFSSFNIKKIMRMTELYPDDFDEFSMGALKNQLATYIIDVRDIDERFANLNGLFATASVERAFSTMKFIKNDLLNRMNDGLLSGCLVPYVEKDVFINISNDAIVKTFQEMNPRRVQL
ncbi:uncharacterized protein LOC132066343 [Lycium ferocissimum]|uniref:uncharacterized protein LOC132066343 n=1 Tax=Lycium ferocissimum TaxID=112874 RepID=UPI0028169456|nr:uncharacterized protein LOC132066343 [Lycium ferocissimum]